MTKIPYWAYPLYKKSDKTAYFLLVKLAKTKKYLKIMGKQKEINSFLKLLILSQKMKNYRVFRDLALPEFKKKTVNIRKILEKTKNIKITRGVDKSWTVFTQDIKLCQLLDKFQKSKIKFYDSNKEILEFVVRFLFSQLLQDWRGALMMVVLESLKMKKVKISKLNNLLKIWDQTKIFR